MGNIDIYSASGRRVRRMDDAPSSRGYQEAYWDGRDDAGGLLANGTYFYRVTARRQEAVLRTLGRFAVLRGDALAQHQHVGAARERVIEEGHGRQRHLGVVTRGLAGARNSGIAVARGNMNLELLLIAGTIGSVVGNCFWYWVGRKLGVKRLKPFVDRWGRWLTVDWEEVRKVERFFRKHGGWMVFVCRFLPTFRTMISLPAGMTRMGLVRFLAWTSAGTLIWNAVLVAAGYYLGKRFSQIDQVIGPNWRLLCLMRVTHFVEVNDMYAHGHKGSSPHHFGVTPPSKTTSPGCLMGLTYDSVAPLGLD